MNSVCVVESIRTLLNGSFLSAHKDLFCVPALGYPCPGAVRIYPKLKSIHNPSPGCRGQCQGLFYQVFANGQLFLGDASSDQKQKYQNNPQLYFRAACIYPPFLFHFSPNTAPTELE